VENLVMRIFNEIKIFVSLNSEFNSLYTEKKLLYYNYNIITNNNLTLLCIISKNYRNEISFVHN